MRSADCGPIFHVEPRGGLGSRMFQYLIALKFQELVSNCRISNVRIPEWDIDHPPIELEEPIAVGGASLVRPGAQHRLYRTRPAAGEFSTSRNLPNGVASRGRQSGRFWRALCCLSCACVGTWSRLS